MVGIPVTINDVNGTSGDICRGVMYQLRRAKNLKRFVDRFTIPELVATFGFTVGDATLLKSAIAELDIIGTSLENNRASISQLIGLGDV